jgi:hypothetical protein
MPTCVSSLLPLPFRLPYCNYLDERLLSNVIFHCYMVGDATIEPEKETPFASVKILMHLFVQPEKRTGSHFSSLLYLLPILLVIPVCMLAYCCAPARENANRLQGLQEHYSVESGGFKAARLGERSDVAKPREGATIKDLKIGTEAFCKDRTLMVSRSDSEQIENLIAEAVHALDFGRDVGEWEDDRRTPIDVRLERLHEGGSNELRSDIFPSRERRMGW